MSKNVTHVDFEPAADGTLKLGAATMRWSEVNAVVYKSSDGSPGITATVALAKITPGGADGELVFKDGLLVGHTDPT